MLEPEKLPGTFDVLSGADVGHEPAWGHGYKLPQRHTGVYCKLAVHGNAMASPIRRKCLFVHYTYTRASIPP
jgi:hypothetical protein